jgi:hypothetical protein
MAARHLAPCLLALVALSLSTSAQTLDQEMLRHMHPAQARALVKQQIDQQAAHRVERLAAGLDGMPPRLTAIETPVSVDVRFPDATFITMKATDDLSGVHWGYAVVTGPHGQKLNAYLGTSPASKKFSGGMSLSELTAFSEPGTYTVTEMALDDLAGNRVYYDQSTLAHLGRTTFVVKNKGGFDTQAPGLTSGKILTPQLSLSATSPGTTRGAYAVVRVDAVDAGDTAVAGIRMGSSDFCTLDMASCFYIWADNMQGGANATLRLSGEASAGMGLLPGTYHLRGLQFSDRAGIFQVLTSDKFGGSTDFSQYFPSTTITLVP